jgi:hypothetical protein
MFTWQMVVLFAMGGCAIGCLLGICIAIEKLAKSFFAIGTELRKMNAKIEKIEVANKVDEAKKPIDQSRPDPSLEDIEAAISNFEKLTRIDLTKPE